MKITRKKISQKTNKSKITKERGRRSTSQTIDHTKVWAFTFYSSIGVAFKKLSVEILQKHL